MDFCSAYNCGEQAGAVGFCQQHLRLLSQADRERLVQTKNVWLRARREIAETLLEKTDSSAS